MATFAEVFSTTWKVLLALFVISLGLSIGYFIIAGIGSAGGGRASVVNYNDPYFLQRAEELHTKMPLSQWNATVKAAIQQHCALEGMTKEQTEKALGKAQTVGRDGSWEYERAVEKECIRYEGENCAEHEISHEYATLQFTTHGYLRYSGDEGGWLHMNCFGEPFYSGYYSSLTRLP